MSKKDKKRKFEEAQKHSEPATAGFFSVISRRGWRIIGIGAGVLTLGFIVLSFTDPRGQNWASTLSPFLIIAGYALIGVGIVTKNPANS